MLAVEHVIGWKTNDLPVARDQRIGHVQPTNTLVQAGLIGEDYLVEMEAEAIVGGAGDVEEYWN